MIRIKKSFLEKSAEQKTLKDKIPVSKQIQQPKAIRHLYDMVRIVYECPDSPILEIKSTKTNKKVYF